MLVETAQAIPRGATLVQWFTNQLLARPFVLVVFGLVLSYFLYFVLRVIVEIRTCRDWIEHDKVDSNSHIVGQLGLFLEESERWRLQGVSVPMTDYSDRIDSFIEGLSDHLHNAVNLFLIVGLAGTFFGMAEFARRAPDLQQLSDPKEVLAALQSALGHSFPIGFLGLCLTIIGHPIASYWESRLREAARRVVNHALRFRTAALRQDSSDALLEAMQKLPEALGSVVSASRNDLIEQLRPLSELPDAIRKANEEAIGPLRELYAESRKEWTGTVTKLNQHTKRMADSIEKLEQPILVLTGKIGEIGGLVIATQQAISQVLVAAEKTANTLQQVQISVDGTVSSLQSASDDLRRLPEFVKADLSNLHETLLASISAYYETLGATYVDGIRGVASAAVGEITTAAITSGGKLNEAASSLRVAADAITQEIQNAITLGADHLRKHLDEFNNAFGQHFPKAVLALHATLAAASTQIETAAQVLEAMRESVNGAARHGEEWNKVNRSLQQVHPALQVVVADLSGSASAIRASAEAHASVPPAIKASITTLETAISNIRKPQARMQNPSPRKSWFDRLFGKASGNGS